MTGLYQSIIPTLPIYHIDRTFLFLRFSRLRVHFQLEVTNSRAPHHTDTTMFRDPWCSFITWPGRCLCKTPSGEIKRLKVQETHGILWITSFRLVLACFGSVLAGRCTAVFSGLLLALAWCDEDTGSSSVKQMWLVFYGFLGGVNTCTSPCVSLIKPSVIDRWMIDRYIDCFDLLWFDWFEQLDWFDCFVWLILFICLVCFCPLSWFIWLIWFIWLVDWLIGWLASNM